MIKVPVKLVNNNDNNSSMNLNFPPFFDNSFGNGNNVNNENYDILPFNDNYLFNLDKQSRFDVLFYPKILVGTVI